MLKAVQSFLASLSPALCKYFPSVGGENRVVKKRQAEEGVGLLPVPSRECLGISVGVDQPPTESEGAEAQCLELLPRGVA